METMDRKSATTTKRVSQSLMIIRTIVNEKRDKRIIPAHATLREVWMRYIGSADMLDAELVEAIRIRAIRVRPNVNGIAYELLTE